MRFSPAFKFGLGVLLLTLFQTSCPARMFEDLSARDLNKKMDEGTRMVIVDLREPRDYHEGHVPSAVNVPPQKLYLLRSTLPDDKTTLVVLYCRGYG